MGYDVTFQRIDPRLVVDELVPRLLDERSPPPSAFDERPDASARWSRARTAVLEGPPHEAAIAACTLVLEWSAASLPRAVCRNLGITYRPLKMEDALAGLPADGFGSAASLFPALLQRRPELLPYFVTKLDDGSVLGALAREPSFSANAIARFRMGLPASLRSRVSPLLSALRAAARGPWALWETSLVLEGTEDGVVWMGASRGLPWPGLARWGTDEGPLSAAEWESLDLAALHHDDVSDLSEALMATDPAADASRAALDALARLDPSKLPLEGSSEAGRLASWLKDAAGVSGLALRAWLVGKLVAWGAHDGRPSDASDAPEVGPDVYREVASSLANRGSCPSLRWLFWGAQQRGLTASVQDVLLDGVAARIVAPATREWVGLAHALRGDGRATPALRAPFARVVVALLDAGSTEASNFAYGVRGADVEAISALLERPLSPLLLEVVTTLLDHESTDPERLRPQRDRVVALAAFAASRGSSSWALEELVEALG